MVDKSSDSAGELRGQLRGHYGDTRTPNTESNGDRGCGDNRAKRNLLSVSGKVMYPKRLGDRAVSPLMNRMFSQVNARFRG